MDDMATIETEIHRIEKPLEYVRRVWRAMRRGENEVRLFIRSNPRWPDYAIYESMDDPEDPADPNDYGPTELMFALNGRTHKDLPIEQWAGPCDIAIARMNWHQVRDLYGKLVTAAKKGA